jgi:transporter family-2 protein
MGALACLTCAIGAGTAAQAPVNKALGSAFGLSLLGGAVTFLLALTLLTLAVASEARASKLPLLAWEQRPAWYHLLPGVLGVGFVLGGILIGGAVGFSLFWIPLIVGQLACSAALDHFGLSTGGTKKPLTLQRAAALVLALAGAVCSVISRLRVPGSESTGVLLAYIFAALCVGVATPTQAALSRAAAARLPSRLQATWWSFSVGALLVALIVAAQAASTPGVSAQAAAAFASGRLKWWMLLGGVFGLAYIASSIFFAPVMGSALYFVSLVCGQLAGSAAVDAAGLFDAPTQGVDALRGVGIAMVVAAAAALAVAR